MRPQKVAALIALIAVIGALTVGLLLLLRIDPRGARLAGPAAPAALDPAQQVVEAPAIGAPSARSEPEVEPAAGERSPLARVALADPDVTPTPDGGGALLAGRVVGSFGQPVADARVFAAPAGLVAAIDTMGEDNPWAFRRRSTQSASDGRFELPLVGSGGQVQIAVRAPGFAPLRVQRRCGGVPPFDLGDLVLEPSVLLSGHVLDSSGRGVTDAELHAAPIVGPEAVLVLQGAQGTLVATTDSGGGFQLDELAVGRYSIEVRHPDHLSATFEGVTEAPGEVRGGIVVILVRGASISGRVEGIPPGQHESYVVHAGATGFGGLVGGEGFDLGRRTELDPDGSFLLRGLHPGRDVGLKVLESKGVGPFGNALSETVVATGGDSGVVLHLKKGLTLSFRAVEADSGEPVSDFEVEVGAPWPEAVRDADGKRLSHHPKGVFRQEGIDVQGGVDSVIVRIGSDRHLPWEQSVPLPAGWEINLGTIRLEAAPMIRVRVIDAETGAGVRGARVTLSAANPDGEGQGIFRGAGPLFASGGEARRGRTGADGRVVLAAVADGPCVLKASHKAYADHPGEEVGPQAPGAEHVLRLSRGGRVDVLVLEADGQPREGARVRHLAPDTSSSPSSDWGGGGMRTTGEDGRVAYTNLAVGEHRFRLAADARQGVGGFVGNATIVVGETGPGLEEEGWEEVTVLDGSAQELTLVSAQRGSLTGRVSEAGQSLSGARVSLAPADGGDDGPHRQALAFLGGGGQHAETDGSGLYELEEIAVGDYLLRVSHATRTMVSEFEVQVSASAGRFDVDLDLAVIEGRVTDGEGDGLVGARVEVSRSAPQGRGRGVPSTRVMSVFSSGGQVAIGSGLDTAVATTDAEGRYRLRGVTSDVDLVVRASVEGRQPGRSEPLRLGANEARSEVDLVLALAGGIRLRVLDAAGNPASFCIAKASFVGETELDVSDVDRFIQAGGSAFLDGLRPGPWDVTARPVGFGNSNGDSPPGSEPQRVEVHEGEVRELEVRLP